MSIKTISTTTAAEAFQILEDIAMNDDEVVFRGHSKIDYRLDTTLNRNLGSMKGSHDDRIEEVLDRFFGRLASTSQMRPWTSEIGWTEGQKRRAKLEFARHHGAPTPLIDFTHSPFIATLFAINQANPYKSPDSKVVVYALDTQLLGTARSRTVADPSEYDRFMHSERKDSNLFEKAFEHNDLRFILFPASWNRRMIRQQGCFIYDTVDYSKVLDSSSPFFDLEQYIGGITEPKVPDGKNDTTLRKIVIPVSVASDVFRKLDIMGLSASLIMDNHEGAAQDVINTYVYNTVSGLTWDLQGSRENY